MLISEEQFENLLLNRGQLSQQDLNKIEFYIKHTPKAYEVAITGAISQNTPATLALALELIKKNTKNHWLEKGQKLHESISND